MFSWSKKQSQSIEQDFENLGLDEPLEISDADLNDPELMAELMQLSDEKPVRKAAPAKKPIPQAVNVDEIMKDDIHVEVTDADLNDPKLLGELDALHANENVGMQTSKDLDNANEAIDMIDDHLSETAGDDDLINHTKMNNTVNESVLDEDINVHEDINVDNQISDSTVAPAIMELESKPETLENQISESAVAPAIMELESKPETLESELPLSLKLQSTDVNILQKYIRLEKVKAATKNKTGDKSGAKESFIAYKQLEQRLEQITQKVVQQKPVSKQSSKVSSKQILPELPDTKSGIIKQLEMQINKCNSISAHYLKSNEKNTALLFHKTFIANIESTQSKLPSYTYKEVEYTMEKNFPELSPLDLELSIIKCTGLNHKEISSPSSLEVYVSWDLGWPTEGPNMKLGKGDTEVIKKSMDPIFNYIKICKIERTKAFQRFLERKKATLEVFHYRGFLWKALSLGKCVIKLDNLLNNCEIHETIDLVDGTNRRPTGAKLEFSFRLRQPLLKPDIKTFSESWLFVEETIEKSGTEIVSPVIAPEKTKSEIANVPIKSISNNVSVKTKSETVVTTKASPVVKTPIEKEVVKNPATDEAMDDLITKFESVDFMVSNNVLEQEQKLLSVAIQKLNSSGPSEQLNDLMDKKQQVDIKLQLLMIQVQSGKLTVESYISQMRNNIIEMKKMALEFKNGSRLDLAKRALARIKLMEEEIKETEMGE